MQLWFTSAQASVQLCNRSDATILIAIGLGDSAGKVSTKGWWKVYPGLCGEPVTTDEHQGSYFIHAKAHPLLTIASDRFTWGEQTVMCVKNDDFDIKDVSKCPKKSVLTGFNQFQGSWKNKNIINIFNPDIQYSDAEITRMAGIQKMLAMLGYPISEISGKMDKTTYAILKNLADKYAIDTFSFQALFAKLDEMIIKSLN